MTAQDAAFAKYLQSVDSAIQKHTEGTLTTEHLSDFDIWQAFHDNRDVNELAREMLESEGYSFVD